MHLVHKLCCLELGSQMNKSEHIHEKPDIDPKTFFFFLKHLIFVSAAF